METKDRLNLDQLSAVADCLKAIAHPLRLRMIEMLLDMEYTVGELAESCGISSPQTSGHLKLMERCDILSHRRDGRNVYYFVVKPQIEDLLACMTQHAPHSKGKTS